MDEPTSVYGKIIVQKKVGGDGSHFVLSTISCLIGRDSKCDIRLSIDGVSREHCQLLVRENGAVYLANLNKSGITLLNGVPIRNSAPLHHLDIFTVCDRSFRWEFPQESIRSKHTKTENILESQVASTKRGQTKRRLSKRVTASKISRPSISPKGRRKSSLAATAKLSSTRKSPASATKGKNVAETSTSLENQPSKAKRSRRRGNKSAKVVSTKLKPIIVKNNKTNKKVNPKKEKLPAKGNNSLELQEESFSFSTFDTPNIPRDVFVSPLTNEKNPSPSNGSAKRKSSDILKLSPNAKKTRLSFRTTPNPLRRSGGRSQGASPLPTTPLSSRKSLRKKKPTKKQNSPRSDYTKVGNIKRLFETIPQPDYTNIDGLKKMFNDQSPVPDYANARGLKRLFQTQTPKADYTNTDGVDRLFRKSVTPKLQDLLKPGTPLADLRQSPRKSLNISIAEVTRSPLSQRIVTTSPSKSPVKIQKQSPRKSLNNTIEIVTMSPSPSKNARMSRSRSKSPVKTLTSRISKSPTIEKYLSPAKSISPNARKGLKRISKSPRISSPSKKSPKLAFNEIVNLSPSKGTPTINVSPAVEIASNKAVALRPPSGRRAAARITNSALKTPSPKVYSPRKMRSATKKTPGVVKSPQSVTATPTRRARREIVKAAPTTAEKEAVKATPTKRGKKETVKETPTKRGKKETVKETPPKKVEKEIKATPTRRGRKASADDVEEVNSPPKSARTRTRAKKEVVAESAKTPRRAAKSSASPVEVAKTKGNDAGKFELTLSPVVEVKTPGSTRSRRIVADISDSAIVRPLRSSKRLCKK